MGDYNPFQFPPNFQIARLHQQASMPGIKCRDRNPCPCCNLKPRKSFDDWWKRDIVQDFKKHGGAVVTYFWLLKFYTIVVALVTVIYSLYLYYCIFQECKKDSKNCSLFIGIWIISNEDLYQKIKKSDTGLLNRILIIRGFIFIILILANIYTVYLVKQFRVRYPRKEVNLTEFSLLLKNMRKNQKQFSQQLKNNFGEVDIHEIFTINVLQPYYSLYQKKLQCYYNFLKEQNEKKKNKLLLSLQKLENKCSNALKQITNVHPDRLIVVFNSKITCDMVFHYYQIGLFDKFKLFFHLQSQNQLATYCQRCPQPDSIIWNNLGQVQSKRTKMKILSVVYFFLLLGFSYGLLYVCIDQVYQQDPKYPVLQFILINIILLFVVAVALTFRVLMNKLSQMRHPNTYTTRTMFIVITTVLFHFVYYIIIPIIYFVTAQKKSKVLQMITNQTLNFLIVQILMAALDFIHCCWNKGQKQVENEEKPIGCQKILHQRIQFPRFPIEFKLIILFKIWSFTIFFAFQVPLIMVIILILLVFLLIKDKHSVYYHYRMEIIDHKVQFNFLRVYSNFFTVYIWIIFVLTQHQQIQFWISFGIMIVTVILQTLYSLKKWDEHQIQSNTQSTLLPTSLQQLQINDSYLKRFTKFKSMIDNTVVDHQIRQYLNLENKNSLQTQVNINNEIRVTKFGQ